MNLQMSQKTASPPIIPSVLGWMLTVIWVSWGSASILPWFLRLKHWESSFTKKQLGKEVFCSGSISQPWASSRICAQNLIVGSSIFRVDEDLGWEPDLQKPLSVPPRVSGKCGLACKPGGATLQGSGGQTKVPCLGKPQSSAANS